jgi:hypothetical protein
MPPWFKRAYPGNVFNTLNTKSLQSKASLDRMGVFFKEYLVETDGKGPLMKDDVYVFKTNPVQALKTKDQRDEYKKHHKEVRTPCSGSHKCATPFSFVHFAFSLCFLRLSHHVRISPGTMRFCIDAIARCAKIASRLISFVCRALFLVLYCAMWHVLVRILIGSRVSFARIFCRVFAYLLLYPWLSFDAWFAVSLPIVTSCASGLQIKRFDYVPKKNGLPRALNSVADVSLMCRSCC